MTVFPAIHEKVFTLIQRAIADVECHKPQTVALADSAGGIPFWQDLLRRLRLIFIDMQIQQQRGYQYDADRQQNDHKF